MTVSASREDAKPRCVDAGVAKIGGRRKEEAVAAGLIVASRLHIGELLLAARTSSALLMIIALAGAVGGEGGRVGGSKLRTWRAGEDEE